MISILALFLLITSSLAVHPELPLGKKLMQRVKRRDQQSIKIGANGLLQQSRTAKDSVKKTGTRAVEQSLDVFSSEDEEELGEHEVALNEVEAMTIEAAMLKKHPAPRRRRVDCAWSDWANDGECSDTCGGGMQPRLRECRCPLCDGGMCPSDVLKQCEGKDYDIHEPCDNDPCPTTQAPTTTTVIYMTPKCNDCWTLEQIFYMWVAMVLFVCMIPCMILSCWVCCKHSDMEKQGKKTKVGFMSILCCFTWIFTLMGTPVALCYPIDEDEDGGQGKGMGKGYA